MILPPLPPLWLATLFDLYRTGLLRGYTAEAAENFAIEHVDKVHRERLADTENPADAINYPREKSDG